MNAYYDDDEADSNGRDTVITTRMLCTVFLPHKSYTNNTAGNAQQDHVSHFLHSSVSCTAATTRQNQRILQ